MRAPGGRHVAQAVRSQRGQVGGGSQRAEGLVGADVGGGLVAADVLLPGAQRHHERAAPFDVRGLAHEPPGDLADELRAAGQQAQVGPAELGRDAERLPLARGDVRAVVGGRRQHRQRGRLHHGHEERAGSMRQLPCGGHGLQQSEGIGLSQDHARDRIIGVGEGCLERGQVRQPVRRGGQLFQPARAGREVGARGLDVVAMDRAADEHPVATRGADGHERRLRGGAGTVVVRGRNDRQARQLADQRLELVDRLQRALADLRLVGRVGRVELTAREDRVDRSRDVVLVHTGTQERGQVDTVAGCERGQLTAEGQLRDGLRQVQAAGADRGGDVVEELLDRIEAERGQHVGAGFGGVGAVDHDAQPAVVSR